MKEAIRIALVQLAWSGSMASMQAQYRDLIGQAAAGGPAWSACLKFRSTPTSPGRAP